MDLVCILVQLCEYVDSMAKYRIITDPKGFAAALHPAIKKRGTQQQAAEAAGADQGFVSKVLSAQARRFTQRVKRLCEYAHVNPEPFLQAEGGLSDEQLLRAVRKACLGSHSRETTVVRILGLLALLK